MLIFGTGDRKRGAKLALVSSGLLMFGTVAQAADSGSFLQKLHHHPTLTTTVPDNGDQNPYAIVIAPASAGTVSKGDVLIDNFNNAGNLQGTGTTIVDYNPATKKLSLFAALPHNLAGCPGGVGLTAAMTMLKSGWVIVGSAPSTDGTTATLGAGCLVVLDPTGKVAAVWSGPDIRDPWGNMAVIDKGSTATLFVSNAGFGVGAPVDNQPVIDKATVLRLDLTIPDGKPPVISNQTVVANGLGEQPDKSVFLVGPTGLALAADGTLYASDATANRIIAIPDAATRNDSAGTGRAVTKDGFLQHPLALIMTPGGHLIATNALNGQAVEIDPATGKQLGAQWFDADKAQTPPGSGDLFGIAIAPSGDRVYYVEDDVNTLVSAQ